MNMMPLESWSVHIALCERKLVADRLVELGLEDKTAWAHREILELQRDLAEIDAVIVRHRATAPLGLH